MRRFFGCYLLSSQHATAKGRTYIGFTVNPHRRIRQHNGEITNGAVRTKRWRPWDMVLVVFGFPTQVTALQFEWAWQHPERSLAVREVASRMGKKARYGLQGKVSLLFEMLQLAPWCYFLLTVQVLHSRYAPLCGAAAPPPAHVEVVVAPMECLPEGLEEGPGAREEGDAYNTDGSNKDDSPVASTSGRVDSSSAGVSAGGVGGSGQQSGFDVGGPEEVDGEEVDGPVGGEEEGGGGDRARRSGPAHPCAVCGKATARWWAACDCGMRAHVECVAEAFIQADVAHPTLPARGTCPGCAAPRTWMEVLEGLQSTGWEQHGGSKRRGRRRSKGRGATAAAAEEPPKAVAAAPRKPQRTSIGRVTAPSAASAKPKPEPAAAASAKPKPAAAVKPRRGKTATAGSAAVAAELPASHAAHGVSGDDAPCGTRCDVDDDDDVPCGTRGGCVAGTARVAADGPFDVDCDSNSSGALGCSEGDVGALSLAERMQQRLAGAAAPPLPPTLRFASSAMLPACRAGAAAASAIDLCISPAPPTAEQQRSGDTHAAGAAAVVTELSDSSDGGIGSERRNEGEGEAKAEPARGWELSGCEAARQPSEACGRSGGCSGGGGGSGPDEAAGQVKRKRSRLARKAVVQAADTIPFRCFKPPDPDAPRGQLPIAPALSCLDAREPLPAKGLACTPAALAVPDDAQLERGGTPARVRVAPVVIEISPSPLPLAKRTQAYTGASEGVVRAPLTPVDVIVID